MPARQGDWKSKSFCLSQNSLRSILSSSHPWRFHCQLAMANYVLPSHIIKLYTKMSVVDSVLPSFEGGGAPVQVSCVVIAVCAVWRWGLAGESLLWPQFSCALRHSGMVAVDVWYRTAQSEVWIHLVSEVHTFSSGSMLCLALYLLLASYSPIHTSGFRMSSFIYFNFQIWLVMIFNFNF